ncbi:hypothetical protein SUDANB105_06714 [Streptomyces sp. enrichment culture]|uniref:hypothetical protein n=1 Tax=Streptomyces sp. enrichment culture TaxID=1795815 RepID=UPI003F57DA20
MTMMPGGAAGIVPGRVSLAPLRGLVTMGPLGVVGNLPVTTDSSPSCSGTAPSTTTSTSTYPAPVSTYPAPGGVLERAGSEQADQFFY